MALDFNMKSIASLRPVEPQQLEIRLQGYKMQEHDHGNNIGYVEELRQKQPYQYGSLQDKEEALGPNSMRAGR